MASPETTAPSDQQAPLGTRHCSRCNEVKALIPTEWPHRPQKRSRIYAPHGTVCLACEKARKAEYEKTRDSIARNSKAPKAPDQGKADDKRKELTEASKLDAAAALKTGARVLNDIAPSVLARLMGYLEDPDHEYHWQALELFAQRILPRKLFEELGGQAAGVGALQDKRPQFQINILPAVAPTQEGRVIDGQVEILPAPDGE